MTFGLRIISDMPRSAPFNMAADLFLMEQCTAVPEVTVRFYSWEPAAVTLGRMQRAREQLRLDRLSENGVTWIRRPTGGRAVLHKEDLTYSVIFSRLPGTMGKDVAATYAAITRCLSAGLAIAGIETSVQNSTSPLIKSGRTVKLPCFLAPNRNEIMAGGKKLIGSAQYRSCSAVLQHGSLPLTPAYRELPRYLVLTEQESEKQAGLLEAKSVSLAELDDSISATELRSALKEGFRRELDCSCRELFWDDAEISSIEVLMKSSAFRRRWLDIEPDNG